MPGKIIYSNDDMKNDLHDIVRQMQLDNFRPAVIVGIARGGLVPATMLSHYYQKPLMVLNFSLRDNMNNQMPEFQGLVDVANNGCNVLIVDDICDSGETLKQIFDSLKNGPVLGKEYPNVKSAVLWNNTAQDVFDPDFIGREISRADDKRWIIFDYEEWWKL